MGPAVAVLWLVQVSPARGRQRTILAYLRLPSASPAVWGLCWFPHRPRTPFPAWARPAWRVVLASHSPELCPTGKRGRHACGHGCPDCGCPNWGCPRSPLLLRDAPPLPFPLRLPAATKRHLSLSLSLSPFSHSTHFLLSFSISATVSLSFWTCLYLALPEAAGHFSPCLPGQLMWLTDTSSRWGGGGGGEGREGGGGGGRAAARRGEGGGSEWPATDFHCREEGKKKGYAGHQTR